MSEIKNSLVESMEQALEVIKAGQVVMVNLAREIEIMRPKAEIYDLLEESGEAVSMRQAAQKAGEKLGIDLGVQRLYSILRVRNIILQDVNHARQEYITRGYFKNQSPPKSNGKLYPCTLVTPKGMAWLIEKIGVWLDVKIEPAKEIEHKKSTKKVTQK